MEKTYDIHTSEVASSETRQETPVAAYDDAQLAGSGSRPRRPSNDPSLHHAHPINFSTWRKTAILFALAWSGFAANYMASAHLTAFPQLAAQFETSIANIANSIGYALLGIAVGPLFWNPLSKTLGRRPVYIFGSLWFLGMCAWLATANSYTSFCVARALAGFASAFSQTVPPTTIADIYPKENRGDKMAWYGLACILAPSISPLIGGVIVNAGLSWRIIYWVVFAIAGAQLLMFTFLVPETLWVEHGADDEIAHEDQAEYEAGEGGARVRVGKRGPAWMPWQRPGEFMRICISPITMARFIAITLPSFYYGMLFAWSVTITIVTPQIFEHAPYNFSSLIVGVTYLAYGIGSVFGKWAGGVVGDKAVAYVAKRHGGIRQPEYRLYVLVPLLPFMFIGLFVVGITLEKQTHWIGPLFGGGIFYFCLVASTGILQTYVLETYIVKSMDTQANFIFWKCMWGFAVAFFAHQWGSSTSWLIQFSVEGALSTALGAIVCFGLIWKGLAIRTAQQMPVH